MSQSTSRPRTRDDTLTTTGPRDRAGSRRWHRGLDSPRRGAAASGGGCRVAGRIRDEDIALVRERSAIDEVVGEYLQLRNAGGGSLKGLCPFHDEKTPSFNVTPARGLWYCFSCADGGDVIKFVEKIDNLSFAGGGRAARRPGGHRAAVRAGRPRPGPGAQPAPQAAGGAQGGGRVLCRTAARAGRRARPRVPGRARIRAGRRGAVRGRVRARRVGGAHPAPARPRVHRAGTAGSAGWPARAGAAPMDRFRGRLIWPIRDLTGDVIAFGARKLNPDEDGPKYLNTPETPAVQEELRAVRGGPGQAGDRRSGARRSSSRATPT